MSEMNPAFFLQRRNRPPARATAGVWRLVLICGAALLSAPGFAAETPALEPESPPAAPVPPPPVVINETEWFVVVAYDAGSASCVAGMGTTFARWFASEFRWPNALAGRAIRVELVPRLEVPWPEPYRINTAGGQVTLYLRWGKDTDWETLARALAHAWLARVGQSSGAANPAAAVPGWLATACGRELVAQLRPALLDVWAREAALAPVPSLDFFTEETPRPEFGPVAVPPGDAYPLQAFWFWRHLRRESGGNTRSLLTALVKGTPLAVLLADALPAVWQDVERHALWLPVGYQQVIRERTPATMNMREAREHLDALTRFVFAPEGEDRRFLPPDLIALRHLDAVRREVLLRLHQLRLDIARANPVWHNAWHAYGVFLENLPTAGENELRHLWREAEAEAAAAAALEKEVNRALQEETSTAGRNSA